MAVKAITGKVSDISTPFSLAYTSERADEVQSLSLTKLAPSLPGAAAGLKRAFFARKQVKLN